MLDIKFIRSNESAFFEGLKKRGVDISLGQEVLNLDLRWRDLQEKADSIRAKKNEIAKIIPTLNDSSLIEQHKHQSTELSVELDKVQYDLNQVKNDLDYKLSFLPNLPDVSVPFGSTEEENIVIKSWGEKKTFDFPLKLHDELAAKIGLSSPDGVLLSGSRFVVLYDKLAKLERGLANFMLSEHVKNDYTEVSVPFLVTQDSMYCAGVLPKFHEDAFSTTDNKWLIPTSEVALINLVKDKILKSTDLPLNLTSYSPCFRSEAGSSGKASHGLTRLHQFHKVELVKIVAPDQSDAEHENIVSTAENILEKLGLHYRRMLLCSQEMGFQSRKTYDLEVWLPAEGVYREISSCSNCGDFQARRLKARVKTDNGNEFVHTLNGSGLAVGRTMIAILENYQQRDGSVKIPEVLVPFVGFDVLNPNNY